MKFIEQAKFNIFKKFSKKPISKEELSTDVGRQSPNFDKLAQGAYNPDNIGVEVYKHMYHTDAQIKAAFSLIKLALLSRKWKVTSLESSQDIVEFIKYNFEHMDSRLMGSIAKIVTSLLYGFSVNEIIWKVIETGKYNGKIGIKRLKSLDPNTITFKVDDKGNLEKVLQRYDDNEIVENTVSLPLEKLIIHTEDKEFGNYYGNSRLKAIYKNWFIKETLIKFWNIALERWGQPLVIGTVPTTDDLKKMTSILENLQNKSAIAKTEGWEIAALETGIGRSSGGDYKDSIQYHNDQIIKGMLVPSLMIESGKGSGSFGLGQTHFDIFTLMIKNLESDMSGIIESFLIKPLVEFNYGEQKSYPEFQFEPLTRQELFNLARTFALLVKNGVIGADEQFMRDMMTLPHREAAEAGPSTVADSKQKVKGPLPPAQTEIREIKESAKKGSQQIKTPKLVADGLTKKEPRG